MSCSMSEKLEWLSKEKYYFHDLRSTFYGASGLQLELWCKGARVWIPHPDLVWRGAELLEDYKGQTSLKIIYEDDEEESTINVKNADALPPLRNPEILIGENDLTSLSYLHEPAVLYNLQVRFSERNAIYTYCGIVLVAINPYEQLPIYDVDTIQAYSGQDMGNLDPHIFAVAEEAFKNMSRFDHNQSIIVSGESGAGKTVSAKYAMRYFATVGGAQAETQIEKKVLASNPIMEAIGNAKTIRNDNSSRFGKYIEISFNKNNCIIGANMRTYLLEKSRVVFQAADERNYHIFYQLCASSELPEFEHLKLNSPDIFLFTNQGEDAIIDGVDDADEMQATREAFNLLGVGDKQQMEIFRVLAGILHMGNIVLHEKDGESCFIPKTDKFMPIMAELFGIEQEQMRKWLCARKIVTAHEVLTKQLNISQAYFARDALSKHIYSQLFNYIVTEVNKALTATTKKAKFIGVLDIYGFETFEVNSFEQFCINYANEKLQQQFCLHVFKLEQEEYMKEQIEWSMIDFYDNQPCIDLIEGKLGLLDLLDEECKMPKGSDANWCQKMYNKHSKVKHFSKPRMSNMAFIVHHFADLVEYQSEGFLEKNRDTVIEEHINILKASQYELVAELFSEKDQAPAKPGKVTVKAAQKKPTGGSKDHRKTVGSQFRESLTHLMETLNSTTPHYVRCIKPNDLKQAFTFEPKRAVQQLRACGVLETIRISAAGYPSRWTYQEFFQRYRVLAKSKDIVKKNMKQTCENVLTKLIEQKKLKSESGDRDKYQFGKTKIFFRAGQVAYLEKLRSDRLRYCGVMIQKHVRGWLARTRYQKVHKMVLLVQRYGRGVLARRQALFLRRTAAATRIQTCWRRYIQRSKYLAIRAWVVKLQCAARALFARRLYTQKLRNARAIVIQSCIRGWIQRRKFSRVLRGIILFQSHVRRRMAKKELKRLKIEARSVEHVKKVAKGLENKVIELQQKLDAKNDELSMLREDQHALHDLRNEYEKLKVTASEGKKSIDRLAELEALVAKLRAELQDEQTAKQEAVDAKARITKEKDEIINVLTAEGSSLKDQLDKANELIKQQEQEKNDLLKEKLSETNETMLQEFESERAHHQKVLKEYARLQQRFENLQLELKTSPVGGHRRSASELSNISLESESSTSTEREVSSRPEEAEEDLGYGSTRRKAENAWQKSKSVDFAHYVSDAPKPGEKVPIDKDLHLVTRLQTKVKELEKEKARLRRELERKEGTNQIAANGVSDIREEAIFESIKTQELEMENSKLKDDLDRLQKSIMAAQGDGDKGTVSKELIEQLNAMREELDRRREECIQLRTLLANRAKGMEAVSKESYGGDATIVNEDGELEMAYRSQKELNKLLEKQVHQLEQGAAEKERELREQLEELRKDNERQQKLIGQKKNMKNKNLTMTPEARIEATMQHEITRLTSENLDLRETIDKQQEQIKKLKKALKIYAKRLKTTEASDIQAELEREMASDEGLPAVKHHKEREYCGMLEYRKEDEGLLIKHLIVDLKPRLASQALPGLPAYLLFMCIRHTDYLNDDNKVRSLLTSSINGIKKIVKKKQDDVETTTLWLANTCRLLHNLKQYSGDKTFQADNTQKQNEHCLRNFDLSEYRQILSDLAVWIYQGLIKLMSNQIQPVIVAALLEHEAIAGLSAGKPTGLRGRSSSSHSGDVNKDQALDQLMKAMNNFMRVLNIHAVDPELVKQVFRQLFYFICANALNNLLLRKDMCHWSKGMQIRYNMSHLEQWMRDNRLQDCGVQQTLDPIIQASQLLQARKTVEDVESICEMCSRLTTSQIIKILNLYTPVNEFEERVPISFIRKIQEHLQKKRKDQAQGLLMDTKFFFAVTFPFNPSTLGLETIQPPQEWGLQFLKRI